MIDCISYSKQSNHTRMPEQTDYHQEFLEYMNKAEGVTVDPDKANAARSELIADQVKDELERAKKGDYAVPREEVDRKTRIDSFPKGEHIETDMTREELEVEIVKLSMARDVLIEFIKNPTLPGFENTQEVELTSLEDSELNIPQEVRDAVGVLAALNFSAELTLFDTPEEINIRLETDKKVLNSIK